jgi:intracellular septation protein A
MYIPTLTNSYTYLCGLFLVVLSFINCIVLAWFPGDLWVSEPKPTRLEFVLLKVSQAQVFA